MTIMWHGHPDESNPPGGTSDPAADAPAARARTAHALADETLRASSGLRGCAKRAMMPLARGLVGRLVGAVHELARAIEDSELTQAQSHATAVDAAHRLTALERQVLDLSRDLRSAREDVMRLRRSAEPKAEGPDHDVTAMAPPGEDRHPAVLSETGYVEFERRFRGSRDEILRRQQEVVHFVSELTGGDNPVLDLGCGRGEWLTVLRDAGIPARGVDSNADMVAAARAEGLDAHFGDLLTHLRETEEGSLGAVTGFHVVEHLPLHVLRPLLEATYLALRPGGIVLYETPNPMNLMVGSASFYLDPTHVRPIHPFFLKFLAELLGFREAEIHYLHPADPSLLLAPEGYATPEIGRVLEAVSTAMFGAQDYALVARRPFGPST